MKTYGPRYSTLYQYLGDLNVAPQEWGGEKTGENLFSCVEQCNFRNGFWMFVQLLEYGVVTPAVQQAGDQQSHHELGLRKALYLFTISRSIFFIFSRHNHS